MCFCVSSIVCMTFSLCQVAAQICLLSTWLPIQVDSSRPVVFRVKQATALTTSIFDRPSKTCIKLNKSSGI